MTIYELLQTLDMPSAYGKFDKRHSLPCLIYLGAGQEHFIADNKIYTKQEQYQVEYYFVKKSAEKEAEVEDAFINDGWIYEKSEDVYVEDEKVYMIYYTVWRP